MSLETDILLREISKDDFTTTPYGRPSAEILDRVTRVCGRWEPEPRATLQRSDPTLILLHHIVLLSARIEQLEAEQL